MKRAAEYQSRVSLTRGGPTDPSGVGVGAVLGGVSTLRRSSTAPAMLLVGIVTVSVRPVLDSEIARKRILCQLARTTQTATQLELDDSREGAGR